MTVDKLKALQGGDANSFVEAVLGDADNRQAANVSKMIAQARSSDDPSLKQLAESMDNYLLSAAKVEKAELAVSQDGGQMDNMLGGIMNDFMSTVMGPDGQFQLGNIFTEFLPKLMDTLMNNMGTIFKDMFNFGADPNAEALAQEKAGMQQAYDNLSSDLRTLKASSDPGVQQALKGIDPYMEDVKVLVRNIDNTVNLPEPAAGP